MTSCQNFKNLVKIFPSQSWYVTLFQGGDVFPNARKLASLFFVLMFRAFAWLLLQKNWFVVPLVQVPCNFYWPNKYLLFGDSYDKQTHVQNILFYLSVWDICQSNKLKLLFSQFSYTNPAIKTSEQTKSKTYKKCLKKPNYFSDLPTVHHIPVE